MVNWILHTPFRSMHTTDSHRMVCPSILCQDATLLACQLSNPGKTSLYIGILACIILETPFSCNNSPSIFKPTCCTCLLCFPLTLGCQALPFLLSKEASKFTVFVMILSHMGLRPLEISGSSSASLSSSESAMKSFTVSAVISAAESAACSLKNYRQDGTLTLAIKQLTRRNHNQNEKAYLHNFVSGTTSFCML